MVAAVAVIGVGCLAVQWRETDSLRDKMISVRQESAELDQLREENIRLKDEQISAEELLRLRADHAALPRLRADLENLKKAP